MRRLGSYQTVTVAIDPDVTDSAAQRKVITSDAYSIDKTSPHLGQASLWVSRYGDGNKVRTNSYVALAKAVLDPPTSGNYTIRLYGYGTTGTLTSASTASDVQTAIRAVSASLTSVTVTGTDPMTIAALPSSSVTLEFVRGTATTGSITQGLASFEAVRPFSSGLRFGDTVEILAKYPAHDEAGLVGMNNLINQALDRLWFVDLLHFHSEDADSDQVTFSLSAYPWLKTRRQVLRAYAPCRWSHTFSYTVPGSSHTLTLDVGFASNLTTSSLAGSATAAVIETAIESSLSSNSVLGTVTVTSNGTTRTVLIEDSPFADLALTVSSGATVTTTRERTEDLRFTDGWRLKYHGEELFVEWDGAFNRGETWYLEVYRPGRTWIAPQTDYQTVGTTWASSTVGFEDDLDQCAIDTNEVAAVAHYLACRQLELYGPSQEKQHWKEERLRAAYIAAQCKSLDLPTNDEPGFKDQGLSPSRYMQDKGFWSRGWR